MAGEEHRLPHKFVVWTHDISNKNWDIGSYDRVCEIENVSEFWRFFNNIDKMNFKYKHIFIMRDDTEPLWEHENNRNGGIFSFKIDIGTALEVFEHLNVHLMCDKLSDVNHDINGLSFSPKHSWAIIKIWNRDKKNNLGNHLNPRILKKYNKFSMKYRVNQPEY